MSTIVIATRESRLALWQAEHVRALLQERGHAVSLLGLTTTGDQILDRTLSKVGGKGLFVKELELALEEGRADIAVHSLKDVPMDLPEGFVLACASDKFINKFNQLWKFRRPPPRSLAKSLLPLQEKASGEMAEWLKAHAWKACVRETVPWVRIPLSPPANTAAPYFYCYEYHC